MRTKLLANYKGRKVEISGRALLKMVDDVSKDAGKSKVPGQGTTTNPYKPRTIDQWRGLGWTTSDTYYHVGISLLRIAPGNYAYLQATTDTGHYSTSKTTLINPKNTPPMVQVEYNREKRAMDKYAVDAKGNRDDSYAKGLSGIDNAKFYSNTQHWEAMSYPEFKAAIVGDPVLAGFQENTVAYLIRHALTDNDPLTSPNSPEPVELAKRKIDGLTLAMFGSEVIRNPREMTIQLMFLDLMQARAKYGSNADKGYTLRRALTRETTATRGIIINDTTKGGKLPAMATGTSKEGREKNFQTTNPLNQVERKDATIIIHWLEHTLLFPYVVDEKWADAKKAVHERRVDSSAFTDVSGSPGHPFCVEVRSLLRKRTSDTTMMLEVDRSA